MTELETLAKYEGWKEAKKRRKGWIKVISFFLALLFAYIAGNLLMKVGLTGTKKVFSYCFADEKKLEVANQSKLPADYITWYKKLKENVWTKKFSRKEDYFTKGEIAKRKAEEDKKEGGGGIVGDIVAWWLSKGLSEEEAKKVDYYQYANHIYWNVAMFLILSWILFYLVFYLIFRYIVLPLSWKEPVLKEEVDF